MFGGVDSSFLMGFVWLRVFLVFSVLLSSASLWRKRDMAVLNAAGGTSTAAPSSALIWAALP